VTLTRLARTALLAVLVLTRVASAEETARARAASLAREGLALLPWDDSASLERAEELMQAALRADPQFYQARADRALVGLLVAAARRDEAARLEPAEGDALRRSGRELRDRALDELRPLLREHGQDAAVVRALAVYYGLDGNAAQTARLVTQARAMGSDPWIDFAELAADLPNGSRDATVSRLAAFTASHPGLLRAHMMLVRAQLDRSRADESLGTLDQILAANPRHDLALRLKASILSPPPARVASVPAPPDVPPPRKPGLLPRKRIGDRPAH